MDEEQWLIHLEKATGIKKYYAVRQLDSTYNIVLGNPYLNPPAVKKGLTQQEAEAFLKLLK